MSSVLLSRLKNLLAVTLVALAMSPVTAPFSTYDLTDHHGIVNQCDLVGAKLAGDEDLAVIGAPPETGAASPVFVLVERLAVADETSKHLIPSRILRV